MTRRAGLNFPGLQGSGPRIEVKHILARGATHLFQSAATPRNTSAVWKGSNLLYLRHFRDHVKNGTL